MSDEPLDSPRVFRRDVAETAIHAVLKGLEWSGANTVEAMHALRCCLASVSALHAERVAERLGEQAKPVAPDLPRDIAGLY